MQRHLLYIFFLLIFCVVKINVLIDFAVVFTDHDQCTLWHAAEETKQGRFHEPCFYGQSYNSNLEAYLAVPLMWLHVPVQSSVPLVTTILGILIFVLTSFSFYLKKNDLAAFAFLVLPLFLPPEYFLVSSMPRGFITGMFLVSIGHFLYSTNKSTKGVFLLFLFATLGFWINPNSAMMALPLGVCFLLQEERKLWKVAVIGTIVATFYKLYTDYFYKTNTLSNYHVKPMFGFNPDYFFETLTHLDSYFFNGTWLLALLICVALLAGIIKKNKVVIVVCCAFIAFFFITMMMERMHDGSDSIFYYRGRGYLAVPWAVFFIFTLAINDVEVKYNKSINTALSICVALLFLFYVPKKSKGFVKAINKEMAMNDHGVKVDSVQTILRRVNAVENLCCTEGVSLVVFPVNCDHCWIDTYAIPALTKASISTLNIQDDRRAWRFFEEKKNEQRKFYAFGCGDPSNLTNSDSLHTPKDYAEHCYIMNIEGNVVDFYRERVDYIRFGF